MAFSHVASGPYIRCLYRAGTHMKPKMLAFFRQMRR